MSRTFLFVLLAFGAVACVERALDLDPSHTAAPDFAVSGRDGGAVDFALPSRPSDLAVPVDMAQAGLSCAEVGACASNCEDDACYNACLAKGSPQARAAFEAITNCFQQTCAQICQGDGQACERCANDAQSPPNGCMSPQCGACYDEVAACGL